MKLLVRLAPLFVLPFLALLSAWMAVPTVTGCAGVNPAVVGDVLSVIDKTLAGACDGLTPVLPPSSATNVEIEVCDGVQGAGNLIPILSGLFGQASAAYLPKVAAAIKAHKPRAAGEPPAKKTRVRGLPIFATEDIATACNDPAENAAIMAYVRAKIAGADAGPTS